MFDFSRFLVVAKTLHQYAPTDEAFARTVVNRAYYTAFHAVKQRVITFHPELEHRTWQHKAVWEHLKSSSESSEWNEIGEIGSKMELRRRSADYDAPRDQWGKASRALDDAQEVVERVTKIAHPLTRGFDPSKPLPRVRNLHR